MNEQTIGLAELVYNYSGKLNNLEGYLNILESHLRQILPCDSINLPVSDSYGGDIEFFITGALEYNNLKFDDNLSRFTYLLDILNRSINGSNAKQLEKAPSVTGTITSTKNSR